MMDFLSPKIRARLDATSTSLLEESSLEDGAEKAKGYWRRYLGDVGKSGEARFAWSQVARLCRSTRDWIGEIHAIVELCSLDGTTIPEISDGLNRWNVLFRQQALYIAGDERQILGRRLLQLFMLNSADANATDFSRAAWASLALHENEQAMELVRQGLQHDPGNEYCLNLAERLQVSDGFFV